MRLIDADELVEEIKSMRIWLGGKDIFSQNAKESILQLIDDEPTAYDIDKVVEELEENIVDEIFKTGKEIKGWNSAIEEAIEIVKRGGK